MSTVTVNVLIASLVFPSIIELLYINDVIKEGTWNYLHIHLAVFAKRQFVSEEMTVTWQIARSYQGRWKVIDIGGQSSAGGLGVLLAPTPQRVQGRSMKNLVIF